GSGIGPTRINRVVGIVKAYTTRVGAGPFPTELFDEMGEYLQKAGGEFGVNTGRPRRCGWYDAVIARYASRVNGFTDYVLTNLDVLTGIERIPVCVAYEVDGQRQDEMPVSQTEFYHATPIFEYFDGWTEDITGARTFEDLPINAQKYVTALEEVSGCRVSVIGVGPDHEQSIVCIDMQDCVPASESSRHQRRGPSRSRPRQLRTVSGGRSEPLGHAVVDVVPAQSVLEAVDGRVLVDDGELDTGDRGEVAPRVEAQRGRHHRVVRGTCREPAGRRGREVRRRLPDGTGHRQIGQRLVRLDDLDDIGREAEPVADVGQGQDHGITRIGVEDETDRVLAVADAERMDLQSGPTRGQRGADLEHMRTEDLLRALFEVVAVVLHQAGAAVEAVAHHLGDADEHAGLPVALGAEAVAVGHEPLHGQTGQLPERAEVFEGVGERRGIVGLEESADRGFLPGRVPQRLGEVGARTQLVGAVVEFAVLLGEGVALGVGNRVDSGGQFVDAPGVDGHAEADLGLGLVAFGHGHIAHVVAEADHPHVLCLVPAGRGP